MFEYVTGIIDAQASQFPVGLNTVTLAYSGDSNYAPASTIISIENIAARGGVTITTPKNVILGSDGSVISTLTLTPSGGYSGNIGWGCSITPSSSPISCYIPQLNVPVSSPVDTLVVINGTGAGTYTVNINGADNTTDGIDLATTFQFSTSSTASPSLAVMNDGPLNVQPGATTGNLSNISIIPSGGFTGQVNLSCTVATTLSNAQSLPICSVPASVTLNGADPVIAQVQVSTTSATTVGAYAVTVTATSASTSSIATTGSVPLTVTASPSFSVVSSGISRVAIGNRTMATVTITPLNGFSGQVDLGCMIQPSSLAMGVRNTCSVQPSVMLSAGSPATVNVSINGDAQSGLGLALLTVSAWDPNSSNLDFDATTDVLLTGAPTFTIGNSNNIQISAGATSGNTSTIGITPANGFTGIVNLTCAVTTSIINASDMPGCTLSPAAIDVTGIAAVTGTLTVTTIGSISGALVPGDRPFHWSGLSTVLALVLFIGIPAKRRAWMRIAGVIVLAVTVGVLGCGGGSSGSNSGSGGGGSGSGGGSNSGTTSGTYVVTVTGTDAVTGKIVTSTYVTLTVK
jgi:hypothetical protein